MNELNKVFLRDAIAEYFKEDDLHSNFAYVNSLPQDKVKCSLKIKEDMFFLKNYILEKMK